MIPVEEQPEPKDFKKKVYIPGRDWLAANGLSRGPLPKDKQLPTYWRGCLEDLHRCYRGVCAYTSIYINPVTGAPSVDHFIAKSIAVEHAYRWRNFRFACAKINGRKGIFVVLDPFKIQPETFLLEFSTGAIYPNPSLPRALKDKAQFTIDRLGLDDAECRLRRRTYFDEWRSGEISDEHLKKKCPFVWHEVHRQKMTV